MSQYKLVSLGIVVEDKPPGSEIIHVSPIEMLYDQGSGAIKEQKQDLKGGIPSTEPVDFETEHEAKSYTRAAWRNIGNSNRITPPDVCQNEKVVLYQYGETDEFYWDTIGRAPGLRGKEDVVYLFSNQEGGARGAETDLETSYFLRVNTRDKFVHLHTSDNDQEPVTFDLKIDTKEGTWEIIDGNGNFLKMDAVNSVLNIFTNEKIEMESKVIIERSEQHFIETEEYTNTATSWVKVDTPIATFTKDVVIDHDLTVKHNSTTNNNSTTKGNSKTGGDHHVGGNLSYGGSLNNGSGPGAPGASINGPVNVKGDITATGNVHGSNINR